MKKIKDIIVKYGGTLAALAFTINVFVINPYCRFFFHEPEVPKELMEYKKNE